MCQPIQPLLHLHYLETANVLTGVSCSMELHRETASIVGLEKWGLRSFVSLFVLLIALVVVLLLDCLDFMREVRAQCGL